MSRWEGNIKIRIKDVDLVHLAQYKAKQRALGNKPLGSKMQGIFCLTATLDSAPWISTHMHICDRPSFKIVLTSLIE